MQHIGPYRIVRTIAIGGMGEVHLAALERAGGFEKRVALKCVLPRLMADPRFVELFEREARLAAALSHRHIVQIFDFGRDHGRSWLAMEYVHGVDLKAVLDRAPGPLPLGVAVEIGVACARALDYAHRARDPRGRPLHLIHRDVSPQNVLLGFEGDIKLADFGLAHAAARDPHEGGLQGKFAYMSPEQVEGVPLDARSDQFALGVVLYEMVSGARAFFAEDGAEAILDRVRRGAPLASLAAVAPALPSAVRAVIERAMRPERTERFEDAGALADALAAAAADSGIRVGDPPLGGWLRARFPERSAAPPAVVVTGAEVTAAARLEATAAAGAPIAPTAAEATVDAGVLIALARAGSTPVQIDGTTPPAVAASPAQGARPPARSPRLVRRAAPSR
ncbi:MAG: serine/threonine protein kinase [Myxococcales bacterium]|nr:serine/threonine protein kinase [Myxococcales bacterium]